MTPVLNRELVRHLLGSFGFVPPPNFGKVGVTPNEFRLQRGVELEFESENGKMEQKIFALWSGVAHIGPSNMRVLGTDICDNDSDYHEFSVVYRVNNSPIHALKHVFDDDAPSVYVVKVDTDQSETWKPVGAEQKLIACAGLERFNSLGVEWLPCIEYEDLLPALLEVVEM